MLLLVNASEAPVDFTLPHGTWGTLVETTCAPHSEDRRERYPLQPFSLVLLRLTP
jgi:hypothetical protein